MRPHKLRSPGTAPLPSYACRHRHAGFTLIELLAVVGIIAILLGIVLSAIETVHRFSRKAVAQVEVRAIEDAWKRYFDYYNRWPAKSGADGFLASLSTDDYHTYRVDATVGKALEGRTEGDTDAAALNPDGIHLMEFTRFAKGGDPANPWYRRSDTPPTFGDPINAGDDRFFYYVRFDVNANNQVSLENIPGLSDEMTGEDNRAARSVIVWTYNPDDSSGENAIPSWSR